MAEPLVTELFGPNATQTETELIISKTDLATKGLTPSANNTAESLFISLQLLARDNLTEANFQANYEQNIFYSDGFPTFLSKGEPPENWRVEQIQWNIGKVNQGATFNPNDY